MKDAITGCLLGTAVGDAVGLACEGVSRRRQERLFPHLDGPRLIGRRGMVSDDTEHTCLVAQALIESAGSPSAFSRSLARSLRFWLLGLPAGVGFATLRATLRLWLGYPPARSGVFSAGNGPAMRSAQLGVCFGSEPVRLRALVSASTRLTHTDPRAEVGALAVSVAAYLAAAHADGASTDDFFETFTRIACLEPALPTGEFLHLARLASESAKKGEPTEVFAAQFGANGVSGYIYQTVPVALHAWFRDPDDLRAAVLAVVRCGGDTDTTAATAGAIVGAGVGRQGIPNDWLAAVSEWPRTTAWMERLATQLADVRTRGEAEKPLRLPFLPLLGRNIVFAFIVIGCGLRRLLPPY